MYSWNRRRDGCRQRHRRLLPHVHGRGHGHVSVAAVTAAVTVGATAASAVRGPVFVGAASGSENLDHHRDSPRPFRCHSCSSFSSLSSPLLPLPLLPPLISPLALPLRSLITFDSLLAHLRFADDYATIKRSAQVQDYSSTVFAPSSLTRIRSLPDLHRREGPDAFPLLARKSPSPLLPAPRSSRPRPRLRFATLSSPAPGVLRTFSSRTSHPSAPTLGAMDRIPKFRRKPKNPTIETAVERSSTDTVDSIASSELQAANLQLQQQGLQIQTQKPPAKLSKRAAFRNFRLRGSTKRARDSPPVELPSSPPPAVVNHDGIKSRPATAEGVALSKQDGTGPRIPAFLDSSMQDIDFKFQELTWAERDRVLEGSRNEADEDFKWGHFKQLDVEEKGVMDRYINIKPWNHNRIRLQVPANELDYVNASEIVLTSPSDPSREPLRYIAMQGPTPPSIEYVWRMIAEQMASPAVIVQLTTMCEGGVIKCHPYFPDNEDQPTLILNEHDAWGDDWQGEVTYDSYEELADGAIEKRKLLLQLKDEDEPRAVWHLLYRLWPDFGVPELEDLDGFFELMRLSRELSAPTNPRIIHCSAGVGRTGTFITLEHLMRELELGTFQNYDEPTEGPDLVYETVDSLREQRVGMVQGKPQFLFIYQVMRKLWQDKYGVDDEGNEPAAKRLEVGDPFIDDSLPDPKQSSNNLAIGIAK
ncbi:hypothetical protein NCS56_00544300 [Fusarium sp. Ph1]|nr:hypothetical protein NCS56_00544300 [Fusarium sp. Ph1]